MGLKVENNSVVQEDCVRALLLIWKKDLCILFGVGHKSFKIGI